mgnify:CR=1 FL=1
MVPSLYQVCDYLHRFSILISVMVLANGWSSIRSFCVVSYTSIFFPTISTLLT